MTYSLADVHFTWGDQLYTGTMDDAISVEWNEDLYELGRGGDGRDFTRVRKNDDSARVTLKLKQSSSLNAILSAAVEADRAGSGVKAFQLKDNLGTTLLNAPRMWIAKRPTVGFSATLSEREWVFETDRLTGTVGGANPE
jgi:hypothetical protein